MWQCAKHVAVTRNALLFMAYIVMTDIVMTYIVTCTARSVWMERSMRKTQLQTIGNSMKMSNIEYLHIVMAYIELWPI